MVTYHAQTWVGLGRTRVQPDSRYTGDSGRHLVLLLGSVKVSLLVPVFLLQASKFSSYHLRVLAERQCGAVVKRECTGVR